MALIPAPPPTPDRDTISVRLDRELHESLRLYAEFLHASKDYVVQAALRRVCDRDKDFLEWRRRQGPAVTVTEPVPSDETETAPDETTARRSSKRRSGAATGHAEDVARA